MRRLLIRSLWAISLAAAAGLSGCGGPGNVSTVPVSVQRPMHAIIRLQLPTHHGVDAGKRYVDFRGAPVAGLKLHGAKRTYWFPEEVRLTRQADHLLVISYDALFVYPRNAVSANDNASGRDRDLENVPVEDNPALIAFLQKPHGQRHSSSVARSTATALETDGGWCDVWDPNCICPDCSWDPTGGWSEQWQNPPFNVGGDGGGGDLTTYDDIGFQCALAGYADDPDLFASCLAAGGPNGPPAILFSFLRQNARDYVWYSVNLDTVTSTQNNPIQSGAFTYSSFYNGLLDGPYYAQGSFLGSSASAPFIDIHQYPTASFGLSQSRFTFYGGSGPVGGAVARFARIVNAASNLGT
jgi:hypothetical protein